MKRLFVSIAALTILAPALIVAQGKPDFSGKWIFSQTKSTRGAAGNSPVIPFPSEMIISQTAAELRLQANTLRQDSIKAAYKLDGSEISVGAPEGITEKAKATWDGNTLVIESSRSFSSPVGDVVTTYKETWTLNGAVLTIKKTQTSNGETDTETGVFDKAES